MLLRLAYLGLTNAFAVVRLILMNDRDKDIEILALRHQIGVLQRQLGGTRVRFSPADRALLAALLHRLPRHTLHGLRLLQTLAVVVFAAMISILIGVPIGILVANSNRTSRVVRPILDFMQTLPVFVYLVPAVFFFGIGVVPGIVATTVFAIPPQSGSPNSGYARWTARSWRPRTRSGRDRVRCSVRSSYSWRCRRSWPVSIR